ncbi:cornifelin homolog [Gouania willdenowi]|uniref:cornifelin homolog n=1 Tax=Gouania willdenowi TaxID=441366 RepID=UPI001055BC0C|nr:cornifelin homolog [Gouania willdenowi]
MPEHNLTNWDSDLCSCCQDVSSCCYGFWCCPCMACTVAGNFGENRCVPLCDIFSPSVLSACSIPLFTPPAVLSLRVGIRHKFGIKGSICNDIATSCVCMWCSWCQMHRELKYRKNQPKVVNMQPGRA